VEPVPETSLDAIISSLPTQPENQLDIGLEILRRAFTQRVKHHQSLTPLSIDPVSLYLVSNHEGVNVEGGGMGNTNHLGAKGEAAAGGA